jgi:hypothetical protein
MRFRKALLRPPQRDPRGRRSMHGREASVADRRLQSRSSTKREPMRRTAWRLNHKVYRYHRFPDPQERLLRPHSDLVLVCNISPGFREMVLPGSPGRFVQWKAGPGQPLDFWRVK